MNKVTRITSLIIGITFSHLLASENEILTNLLLLKTMEQSLIASINEVKHINKSLDMISTKLKVTRADPLYLKRFGCLVGDPVTSILPSIAAPPTGSILSSMLGYAVIIAVYHIGKYTGQTIASHFEAPEDKNERLRQENQLDFHNHSKTKKAISVTLKIIDMLLAPLIDFKKIIEHSLFKQQSK